MSQRTLIVSDIHGAHRALLQVLERAEFRKHSDHLIVNGDVVDGWKETTECVRYLNTVDNLTLLLGNHDDWCRRYLADRVGDAPVGLDYNEYHLWYFQGGMATIGSMLKHDSEAEVYEFLQGAEYYYEQDDRLFVHAGIIPGMRACNVDEYTLIWDRYLAQNSRTYTRARQARGEDLLEAPYCSEYKEVFIGHTPTFYMEKGLDPVVPLNYSNVWMIDTGASYHGRLTVMDVDTKEFWQSDPVPELYPGEKAR